MNEKLGLATKTAFVVGVLLLHEEIGLVAQTAFLVGVLLLNHRTTRRGVCVCVNKELRRCLFG